MGLNFNVNFDFESIELERLANDKLAGGTPDVANNPATVSSGFDVPADSQNSGMPTNQTEQLDLSDIPGSETTPKVGDGIPTSPTDTGMPETTSQPPLDGLNKAEANTLNFSRDPQATPPGNDGLLPKDGKTTPLDIDFDPIEPKDPDKKASDGEQPTNSGGRSGGGGGGGTPQGTTSSDTTNIGGLDAGLDPDGNAPVSGGGEAAAASVVGTSIAGALDKGVTEIDIDDYILNLKANGLRQVDIDRVISGKISIEDLMKEIEIDTDNSRRQEIMQASYLQAYGIEFTNLGDFNIKIDSLTSDLASLVEQRKKLNSDREIDAMIAIITSLKMGESLNNTLNTKIVAWQYTDKDGNVVVTYDEPNYNGDLDVIYTSLTFEELYPNNELLNDLKSFFEENGIDPSMSTWVTTDDADEYFTKLYTKYNSTTKNREADLKKLDESIKKIHGELSTFQYIYSAIENEIAYYIKNVDAYINKTDFIINSDFNPKSLEVLLEIKKKYDVDGLVYGEDMGFKSEQVNDKSDLVNLLACMINGEGSVRNGTLLTGPYAIEIFSDDDMLRHYQQWVFFINEQEKMVFNFIFNTEGIDAAYQYLEDISDELDNRWLANKTKEDQEFAKEYPFLASIASIIVTPFEGISAACFSFNALANGEKIRRSEVYSAGNVWRAQVARDITINHGEGLGFVYSTVMSMSDSVLLIGLSAATGGVLTPVFSVALMGSRSYVSTLNDALDRGLSDGDAVLLAGVSAIVESAMESFSVGHLLKLEKNLGNVVVKLTGKIANNIKNQTVAKIVTKSFYVAAFALSQGLAEGEEEFTTEILNYVADIIISKDLSSYTQSIQKYLEYGYTEDQALVATMQDLSGQAFQAFLGGFVSGICFGSFSGISSTIKTSDRIAKQMYDGLKGTTSAQMFASAIEINQNQLNKLNDTKNKTPVIPVQQVKPISDKTTDLADITIESSASVTNPPILDYINMFATDLKSFSDMISKINNYTEDNVPLGFSSVADYKKAFVKTLIESGKLYTFDSNCFFELIKDSIMLKELIGTSRLNNFLVLNLKEMPEKIAPALDSLSVEDFNEIFSATVIEKYINSLSPKNLGIILSNFKQNFNSWLGNDAIINKITNFETNDFYNFINEFNFYHPVITDLINSGKDVTNYFKFLDSFLTKYYTNEILLNNVSYINTFQNFLPSLHAISNENVTIRYQEFIKISKSVKNTLSTTFQSLSDIELKITPYSCSIKVDPKNTYYDLVLEIDGNIEKLTIKQLSGEVDLEYSLMNKQIYVSAALSGKLKIKSIVVNQNKSNLVLEEVNGLKKGLNEVVLLLDGVERKIIVSANSTTKDLNYDYYVELSKYNDIQVKSIKAIGTKNIVVGDPSSLHVVSYKVGDQTYEAFLKPNYKDTLLIDEYISENSLFDISDIKVSIATHDQITAKELPIKQYKASSEIFTTNQYGGNQSDVPSILGDYLNAKILSPINKQKALILNKLIDKYFPNSTDLDKIKMSLHYEEGGCLWMAVSNAFATYMGSIENGAAIFLEKIGFDLSITDGQMISYNMEAIAFDMYLSYFSKLFKGNSMNFLNSEEGAGVSSADFKDKIAAFFIDRGINIISDTTKTDADEGHLSNELFSRILNNKGFSILSAKNFDMQKTRDYEKNIQSLDKALENAKTDGKIVRGVGSHAMLITGIKENMDIVVSSWSEEYAFLMPSIADYKSMGQDSNASIYTIEFSIPTNEVTTASSVNISGTSNESDNSISGKSNFIDMLKNLSLFGVNNMNVAIENDIKNVVDLISKHDSKYGPGKGLEQIKAYIDKNNKYYGNPLIITSEFGARDLLKQFTPDQVASIIKMPEFNAMLNKNGNPSSQDIAKVIGIITKHDSKYGYGKGISELRTFSLENHSRFGDTTLITSQYGAREALKQFTPDQIASILNTPEFQALYNNKVANYKKYTNYSDFISDYLSDEQFWKNNLNPEQKRILENYLTESLSSSYATINGLLRGTVIDMKAKTLTFSTTSGDTQTFTFKEYETNFGEKVKSFINRTYAEAKILNNAITKNTLKENTLIYRGVHLNSLGEFGISKTDSEAQIKEKLIGQNYTDNGFMSSSPDPNGGFSHREVIFEMNCPKGTSFGNFSTFNPGEKEILLPLGSVFEIFDVKIINGKIHVYMTKK